MQIFLKSHTRSFLRGRRTSAFTLPELLISIAIIGIITSITLVKYSSFDSTVLTKSAAYEAALTLREAQINSVSVKRGDGEDGDVFSYPYGVHFTKDSSEYTAFVYEDTDNPIPLYSDTAKDISTFSMERGIKVYEICINNGNDCDIETFDISFKRPDFNAIFHGIRDDGTAIQTGIINAQIKFRSLNGIHTFIVEVSNLGQISVYKED